MLIVAWELLAYTASDFFFPGRVPTEKSFGRAGRAVYHGPWANGFNYDLFQALNVVGLAFLLIIIGYEILKRTVDSKPL